LLGDLGRMKYGFGDPGEACGRDREGRGTSNYGYKKDQYAGVGWGLRPPAGIRRPESHWAAMRRV